MSRLNEALAQEGNVPMSPAEEQPLFVPPPPPVDAVIPPPPSTEALSGEAVPASVPDYDRPILYRKNTEKNTEEKKTEKAAAPREKSRVRPANSKDKVVLEQVDRDETKTRRSRKKGGFFQRLFGGGEEAPANDETVSR